LDYPDIDEGIICESPYLFQEPTLYFSSYGGGYEGNKSKIIGLTNNDPFDVNTDNRSFDKIKILPVVPNDKNIQKAIMQVLNRLQDNIWEYNSRKYGFSDLFSCELEFLPKDSWYFVNKFSRAEYERKGKTITDQNDFRERNTRNIVLYITHTSSSNRTELDKSEYFGMKQALVQGFIPSQSLSTSQGGIIAKAKTHNLKGFSLVNLASQIYAKVGGVPWALKQPDDETYAEVNIGIRAGIPKKEDSNYIYGVAQIFSKDGKWIDAAIESEEQPIESKSYELSKEAMKELLNKSIQKYLNKIQANTPLEGLKRVNIHKPKGFSQSEINAVKEFSNNTDADYSLIGISKSKVRLYSREDEEVGNIRRGYFKKINQNAGILCTTGDHENPFGRGIKEHKMGTPVPLLVQVVNEEEFVVPPIENVAYHVFVMTRLNWGDVLSKEVSEPVTLHYAQKVAKMAANGIEVKKINEDIPWFL